MRINLPRRQLLRGLVGGAAVSVAVPMLDMFLDSQGRAVAATGAPLPRRFGTWFWGCGYNPTLWVPKKAGADYDLPGDLKPIAPYRAKVNVLSGFNVELDGAPNDPHFTGLWGFRTGKAVGKGEEAPATFDVNIADVAGEGTRFRSLEIACNGDPKLSYSRRGVTAVNPPEASVTSLYARLFGSGFQDPNSAEFKPSVEIMTRKSVLSAVADDRKALMAQLGASDRARMDEYFTSLRQIEEQLALQLRKPEPLRACVVPPAPGELKSNADIDLTAATHKVMTQLLAMALACNQTKVFNVAISDSASSLRKPGTTVTFHTLTHEELVDAKLGYQPESAWFNTKMMELFGDFLGAMDGIKEGDGTLLDNCFVVAHSDCSMARSHEVTNLPVMTAGRLGGKVRTGLHIVGNGQPVTRVGLTAQQVMGVPVERWGTKSMDTNRPLTDILA